MSTAPYVHKFHLALRMLLGCREICTVLLYYSNDQELVQLSKINGGRIVRIFS